MRAILARFSLAAIAVVGLLEIAMGTLAYRDRIVPDDWAAVREAIAQMPDGVPIYVADPWMAPRARMELPRLREWASATPPDLWGVPAFAVLGVGSRQWSAELEADSQGLLAPQLVRHESLGALELHHYRQPQSPTTALDLLALDGLKVGADGKPCPRRGDGFRCKRGRVSAGTAEIDYRPRRCLRIEVLDGTTVELARADVELGSLLRGHVGFHDFNGRLRSDAPIRITVRVDDTVVVRRTVTDAEGWSPFAAPVEPGRHDVALEVLISVQGTWRRGDLVPRGHIPCVELRSLGGTP